ncbi:hypothetical protein E2542_SST18572 [Spatholobus suberectus]|nr:hypothetical protein E2542_SST18572 [Spatholobus suberectus]
MVGLSVVLEAQKGCLNKKTPQVINKTTMMLSSTHKPSFPPSLFQTPTFLDQCFLCGKRLLPGKDIYMYKGDRAFCSVECRCKQIFTDEQEAIQKEKCSLAAMRTHIVFFCFFFFFLNGTSSPKRSKKPSWWFSLPLPFLLPSMKPKCPFDFLFFGVQLITLRKLRAFSIVYGVVIAMLSLYFN